MSHDTQALAISREEAKRIDEEGKRKLLAARKLSLVVDLDQTIIHAAVDPTIAEWQKDRQNPNHEAVKDVRAFQLIDDGPGMRGCWYYIKLRPGLDQFLENISQIYELHIYTMATRQYAQQIANIVDPSHKLFGDRILSRDESGSMVEKSLARLFPVDTKMVVIIDDRGDIWKFNDNLIQVPAFTFFPHIGDINSSFLPKKQESMTAANADVKKSDEREKNDDEAVPGHNDAKVNGAMKDVFINGETTPSQLEEPVELSNGDDPAILEVQARDQDNIITSQLEEKPLLQMQKKQDEEDEAAAALGDSEQNSHTSTSASTNGDSTRTAKTDSESSSSDSSTDTAIPSPRPHARHSILRDDDTELIPLEAALTAVHTAFFADYDRKRLGQKGGRVTALSGKRKIALDDDVKANDLLLVPDIKHVMPALKARTLPGVTIVFSGIWTLDKVPETQEIYIAAGAFGARVEAKVGRGVTHVVAARTGTAKVKAAAKRGIKVVDKAWLFECFRRWKRVDERPYLLDVGPVKSKGGERSSDIDEGSAENKKDHVPDEHDFLLSSSEGETPAETEVEDGGGRERKKLKLETSGPDGGFEEIVDDGSPIELNADDQADIDAEMREFMGSDMDSDSDTESVVSLRGGQKRKRIPDHEDTDGDFGAGAVGFVGRGATGLRTVANAASENESTRTSTPVANGTLGTEEDEETERQQRAGEGEHERREEGGEAAEDDDDSDDGELERELERELESASRDEYGADDDFTVAPISSQEEG